jgi:transposase
VVQTVCRYLFHDCGKISPINIHRCTQAVYGDKCVDVSTIRHWVRQFKGDEVGEASLFDKARLGRPMTAADKSRQERFEEMAPKNY